MSAPTATPTLADPAPAFRRAMEEAGLLTSDSIIPDGTLRRVHVEGDRRSDRNGWYVLYPDDPPAGKYGCWKRDFSATWCARPEGSLSPAERDALHRRMENARQHREAEEQRRHEQAAERARRLWDRGKPADPAHPYLAAKQVRAHGLRQLGDMLLLPVRGTDGTLRGLQTIAGDGTKRFLWGTEKKGGYHSITTGRPNGTIVLAEGYATGATIHQATGHAVAVAFDCGNLGPVAEALRAKYPNARFILAADNDHTTKGNPGITHATEAARAVNGLLAVPRFGGGDDGSDWNDIAVRQGLAAVAEGIEGAGPVPSSPAPVDDGPVSASQPSPSGSGDGEGRGPTQSQTICELAAETGADLWRTPDGTAYATVPLDSHREHWPVRRKGFREWIVRRFYLAAGKPPGAQAVADALGVIEARARFEGEIHPVYLRVGEHGGNVYLDLGDETWQAVEITAAGWRVVEDPPVRFRRPQGMAPLPEPVVGGSVEDLRPFVNIGGEDDWRLLIATLVCYLRPRGPYPVLAVQGEQGSAKSTLLRIVRALVDPSTSPLRTMPRNERDLMIAANNGWCIALDNLSRIPEQMADGLCRLATGGGFATRELYSNDEETIFDATRPVLLNGIEDLTARDDLRDRAVVLSLPTIRDGARQDEATFWGEFNAAHPKVLGALLTGVSGALRHWETTHLEDAPRMADFARWVTAAEDALGWPAGAFLAAYTGNRHAAVELTVEHEPVAAALQDLAEMHRVWTGSATDLLDVLTDRLPEEKRRSRDWPKNARALSGRLARVTPALRRLGIEIERDRATDATRRRIVRIQKSSDYLRPDRPQRPPSEENRTTRPFPPGRKSDDSDANASSRTQMRPSPTPHKHRVSDDPDGSNAKSRPFSDESEVSLPDGGSKAAGWRVEL